MGMVRDSPSAGQSMTFSILETHISFFGGSARVWVVPFVFFLSFYFYFSFPGRKIILIFLWVW